MSELKYLNNWETLFPSFWTYSLLEYSKTKDLNERTFQSNLEEKENLLFNLSHLKIASICLSFNLSDNDYSFILNVLLLPSVKNNLTYLKLNLVFVSYVLEVLDLLSNCINIECIELSYLNSDDIINSEEAIKEAKITFFRKIGIIPMLSIFKKQIDD